jgi:hypothetical protein
MFILEAQDQCLYVELQPLLIGRETPWLGLWFLRGLDIEVICVVTLDGRCYFWDPLPLTSEGDDTCP